MALGAKIVKNVEKKFVIVTLFSQAYIVWPSAMGSTAICNLYVVGQHAVLGDVK